MTEFKSVENFRFDKVSSIFFEFEFFFSYLSKFLEYWESIFYTLSISGSILNSDSGVNGCLSGLLKFS